MFQQHHGESLSEAWTHFKDLLQKVPHHGIDLWLQVQIFYDHVNPVIRRTIDQSAGGKLCDLNAEESWALLEDLALYDNESWNDPRDFAKPVKAITLPQDVPSTSDRRLIELENQVQLLMEAHLAPAQPTQVNKITTLCEIYSGPHDTQYCMEDPKQALVEYASSRTDEAEGKWYTFKPEQNNLGDTYNPSWRSHPNRRTLDCPSLKPISNDNKAHFNDVIIEPQQPEEPEPTLEDEFKDLHLNLPVLEVLAYAQIYNAILDKYIESLELGKNGSTFVQEESPAKIGDPGLFTLPCRLGDSKAFDTLADLGSCVNKIPLYLFKKLNIGLLEETDHIFRLADGTKSYPVGIVKDVEVHIEKLKLLNDFYVLNMKKDPETLLLVGRGFLATANAVIDCRMVKIAVGEGITRSEFSVKGIDLGEEEAPYWTTLGKRESYKLRPSTDEIGESEDLIKKLINWDKPPKNGDEAWHAKIRLIDPDGEEFTKTLQSIPTTRKLSERESPREIIDLDHFYDTLYLMRRSLEILRKFHWMILGGRFNQLSHVSSPLLSKPGEY
ncbi:MAK10-like protein [Tanacetum coccineum]